MIGHVDTTTDFRINWFNKDTITPLALSPKVAWDGLNDTVFYFVSYTDTATGCTGSKSAVAVIFMNGPEYSIVKSDADGILCFGQDVSVNLQFTSPTTVIDSISWYADIPGYPLMTGMSNLISPDSTIKYNIYVEDTSGCSTLDFLWLTVVEPLDTPASLVVEYCQYETAYPVSSGLSTGTSALGQVVWYNGQARTAALPNAPIPNTTQVDTIVYYYTETDTVTGCTTVYGDVETRVYPLPMSPITASVEVCENDTTPVQPYAATTIVNGILNWYQKDSVTSIVGTPLISGSTITDSTFYTVRQKDTTTGCFSEVSQAQVIFNEIPDAAIVSTDSLYKICLGDQVSLALTKPQSFLAVSWNIEYTLADGTKKYVSNVWNGVTFTHQPDTTTLYIIEALTKDSCLVKYQQLVTVQPLPKNPAIRDYTYCQFSESYPIAADSVSSTNKLLWHRANGQIDTVTILPAPTTALAGVSYRYVQQYDPVTGCVSPMDTATITINALPTKPTTQERELCEDWGGISWPIADTTLGIFGALHWFELDSITAIDSLPLINGNTLTQSSGYLVKQEDIRTGCYSEFALAPVTIIPKPDAQIISTDTLFKVCEGESITLALTLPQKFNIIRWHVEINGVSTSFNQGTGVTFTHSPSTTTKYLAEAHTTNGCWYTYQQMVTVQPLPATPALNDYEYCQFTDAFPLTADSLSSGNKLLWHKANGAIDTVQSLPAPSTQNAGTFYFYVQQFDPITGCSSEMDTAEVIVNALPITPTTEDINVCEASVVQVSPGAVPTLGYDPFSQAYGIIHWYDTDSVTEFSQTPMVSGSTILDTTYYLVRQEDIRTGCLSSFVSAQVNFIPKPDAQIISSDVDFNICSGDQISLGITPATGLSSIVWDVRTTLPDGSPITFFDQGTGATFVHRPDTTSEYIVRMTNTYGCEYTLKQLVSVQALPKKPGIPDITYYCQSEDALSMTGASLEVSNKLLWHRSTGLIDTLTVLPAPQTDTTGTFYRYVQQYDPLTGCVSEMDTAVIIIRALPAPPIAKSYWICKDTSPDTLLVDQGPYSAQYLSNLRIQWFTDNNTLLDTAPAVPTSDIGLVTYFVRHENQLTGCISPLVALNANIYQVQIDSITNTDASCYTFTDAEINVKGSGPFPVQWSWVDAGTQQGTGPPASSPSYSSGAIINVGAGSYEIVAKDVQGCTSVNYKQNRFFVIDEPAPITINEIVASRPSCHDTNDASIEIFATGRNNLLYSINNGGNWQNTGFFGGLSPYTLNSTYGNEVRRIYNIQVTDSVGCPVYQRTTQPDSTDSKSAVVGITTVTGSLSTGTYDPLLGEGVATSSNYAGENTLNWWPNGNLKITNDASWLTVTVPYNNVQNTQVQYSKLATGTSEVLITRYIAIQLSEINGSDTIFRVISKEDVLNVNSTSGVTGNLPFAVNGGQAIINYNIVDEGIDPGLYKIDIASYHRARITTNTVNDEVSVQAFQGSTFNGTLVVELFEGPKSSFRLEETMPTTVTTAGVVNDISCWGAEDGRIDISWSSTNDVYVSVDSGATYTSVSTAAGYLQYDNLDSGAYYVTLKDENNCYVYYDEIRSYELRSPGPIVLDSILVTPNSCYDPEVNGIENDDAVIQMFAHGGIIPDNDDINYVAPQLVYSIEGGQLGSWSTQNTFASLDTGWYHLKVSNLKNTLQDPMGCVNEYMINPYYYVDQPDSLRLDSLYYIPVQCYDSVDAFVEFYASGGNNISYSLDTLNFQTGSLFENVAPAEYFPTIEDDKNCPTYYYHKAHLNTTTGVVEQTYLDIRDSIEVEEPSPMFINFVTSDLQCNEVFDSSSIEVVIIGGNIDPNTSYDPLNPATYRDSLQGFVYEWSFDSTSAVQGQYGYFIDTLSWDRADSLWAGTYNLYVEDYKGCFVEGSVTLNQPDSIRLDSIYTRPVSCWDSSNAILEIYASGGNGLFYSTDSVPDTSQVVNWSLTTSYYTLSQGDTSYVYLRDTLNQDCFVDYKADRFHFAEVLDTFTVDTAIVTPVLCFGDTTGTILVQTSGGLNPLFNFDTLSTAFDTIGFITVPSDSVYITVSDINGCTPKDTMAYTAITRKLFVPQPDPLVVLAATDSNVFCAEDTTGIISAFVAGGTTPYDILWTSGDTTLADSSVSAGLYYIEVIDTNGCYAWDSTSVFAIDSDCDLIADSIETYVDYDLDGLPNAYDLDSDNDGLPDSLEYDYNRDGIPLDDCDGDGWPNYLDPDICEFYVPSVITPNSDGDNDALFIPGLQYFNNFKFTVFNSMGNKVYQVENSNINFNGSTSGTVVWSTNGSLPSGTYYYVLEIRPNKWTQTGYIFLAR
ncbi:gliding motility-associated C-terminal domain-containing protein [Schleiferiaceae bacterium]|nr:gliding motility-associated C-terminal domain-containing protein [Schleiferiaceae bacterium]